MASFRRLGAPVWHRKSSWTKDFSDLSRRWIGSDYPWEEETLPFYKHEQFYPVRIGEVFNSRYQVVGKLGYGAYSTVWLSRDLNGHKYAALKVSTQLRKFPWKTRRELVVYEHLSKIQPLHPGQAYIRGLYDTFEVSGPHGRHQCLIQPPMHISTLDMLKSNSEPFNPPLLRLTMKRLLTTLDFLHTEAGVVHTDLKTDNLMLTIADTSMLEDFEKAELEDPSPRKIIDETRTIYTSRSFGKPKNGEWGCPVLCDFGEARIGRVQETGPMVQPHIYRAPEVTFEMPWGPAVDIWNVATLIWDLFEDKHLFHDLMDEKDHYDPFKHMAQITGFLGSPPREFMPRSETTLQCSDVDGKWIADENAKIPETSLEKVETRLEGRDKELFLRFIRSMLKWLPGDRKTARELLDDPWLNEPLE